MNTITRHVSFGCAVLLTGCLIAACGSASSSSSTSSSASASASTGGGGAGGTRFTALRSCLKAHGVTLPTRRPGSGGPPGGGGGGFFGGGGGAGGGAGGGLAARNPKLAAAMKACGANFRGGGRRFRLNQAAVTKYVACVRSHGYNLPNPNFSGKGPVFPASIRTDPKFQSASKACQSLLIPPRGGSPATATS